MNPEPYIFSETGVKLLNPDYLKTLSIFVATPCYGGQMFEGYFRSAMSLKTLCNSLGLDISFFTVTNESLITRARNTCTAHFLQSSADYLLFIDSDIEFNAEDVLRLLAHKEKIVAGAYAINVS